MEEQLIELKRNPREKSNVKKLQVSSSGDEYRLRVGDKRVTYRLVMDNESGEEKIKFTDADYRKDIY